MLYISDTFMSHILDYLPKMSTIFSIYSLSSDLIQLKDKQKAQLQLVN